MDWGVDMGNKEQIDERITDIEEQILYFILKDKKYIERIFSIQKIPVDYFQDRDVRTLAKMAYEYFIDFKSLLIEDEMNKSLNALFSSKKIDNIRLSSLKSLFEELSDPLYRGGTVHDEQFNRILKLG